MSIDHRRERRIMQCIRKVTDSIYWVGGSDRRLALFENIFPISRGVSYNAYVILDDKTALMDTADYSVGRQFMENVAGALNGRTLDYLVVDHMEPDHCAWIKELKTCYPDMKIVGNAKTFQMIDQFFTLDLADEDKVVVKENDTLELGRHTLTFVMAPMVHWPEAMVSYESTEKILFSADAFGSFGALDGRIFDDELHFERDWMDDARRYYTNIVGKYGMQVQALLKKAAGLDIRMICPLHGPIWRSSLNVLLEKYDKWSRYEAEEKGVLIIYGSMYGHTEGVAQALSVKLAEAGVKEMAVYDVSNTHMSQLIAEAFRYSHIVLACPTYNGGIYPPMDALLHDMKALNMSNKVFGVIENGTWAPASGRLMTAVLETLKGCSVLDTKVTVKSDLKQDKEADLDALCQAIAASM